MFQLFKLEIITLYKNIDILKLKFKKIYFLIKFTFM